MIQRVVSQTQEKVPCPELVRSATVLSDACGSPRESTALYRIKTVLEFVDASPIKAVTVEAAAALVFLSPSRFRYLFRQHVGLSFHQYVITLRLERAHYLLRTTNYNVAEIVSMLGIEDKSHFVRDYKRAYGVSPAASRPFARTRKVQQIREVSAT